VQVFLSLLGDRDAYRPGTLRRSWRNFRSSPLVHRDLWVQLRDYNRADFHPDDHDASELIDRWKAELFGSQGSLNDKLANATTAA